MKYLNSKVAFIGSAGVPNRYGGFEAFIEYCGPEIAKRVDLVIVTCDASLYKDRQPFFERMHRVFIPVSANGVFSIFHDLISFFVVFFRVRTIFVLGISGAPWFPLFRLMCTLTGKRLIVNVDGVEWRRKKFGFFKRVILRAFDSLAQIFSHTVIFDNYGLQKYIFSFLRYKSFHVAYPGDYVLRNFTVNKSKNSALTVCRIEPENNIEMLIEGVLSSCLVEYVIVGNWDNSAYGRDLREKYVNEFRLKLINPIYDASQLSELRERCEFYLHGHSVGGTNPSLVEMLFYDCKIFCFDVDYNRHTAGEAACYFRDGAELARMIQNSINSSSGVSDYDRSSLRNLYTRAYIADRYFSLIR